MCDTDSVAFVKPDHSPFTKEEIKRLQDELNTLAGTGLTWDFNFYADSMVVLKTKNYTYKENGKVTVKGNSIKASTKEPALKEFSQQAIRYLLEGEKHRLRGLYDQYAIEACNIKDMKRWAARKTISAKILAQERTMEQKVYAAVKHLPLQEGDRHYLYFKSDQSLALAEDFNGDYCKETMLKKLFLTIKIFETVLDINEFPNYSLKRNKKLVEELCKNV